MTVSANPQYISTRERPKVDASAQRQYDQKFELVSITHDTSEETHYALRQIALDLPLGLILVVKQVLDGFYP